MGPVDIVILVAIAAALAAVVLRVRRKGVCADCSEAGTCAHKGSCMAHMDPLEIEKRLGKGL